MPPTAAARVDLVEERATAYGEAPACGSSENLVWNASAGSSPNQR